MTRSTLSLTKPLAIAAMVLGIAAGSYGIASAATGSGSTTTAPAQGQGPPGATAQNPWGNQRSDETLLTGDTLTQVKAAALAKLGSNATVVRIETDADGHAAYEAHMLKTDGTPATVYVDKSFNVVSVETR
ncbi:MAG: PepSY domain-containing protein [Gaiellaceae bacterium]